LELWRRGRRVGSPTRKVALVNGMKGREAAKFFPLAERENL
jgi:hypothetical protein